MRTETVSGSYVSQEATKQHTFRDTLDHRSPGHSGSINVDKTHVLDAAGKIGGHRPRVFAVPVTNDRRCRNGSGV